MTLIGFSDDIVEKMKRLCDLLSAIQHSDFLSKRLSLYGGTALNFLFLPNPRLSEDLDYNYRDIDAIDWGKTREKIDKDLKWIIRSLGYKDEQIKINSLYNQCRFHLNYISETGIKNDIKIEIGYMRRIPLLQNDDLKQFHHLITNENITVMTPKKEELFANKFTTMISRSRTYLNPRDIFDVYSISNESCDKQLFKELVTIECILMDISSETMRSFIDNLLYGKTSGKIEQLINQEINFKKIRQKVAHFSKTTIDQLDHNNLMDIIDKFFSSGELNTDEFSYKDQLNHNIQNHPQITWLRKTKF